MIYMSVGQSGLHHNFYRVSLVLVTKTTYTSSTLRVGLIVGLICRKARNVLSYVVFGGFVLACGSITNFNWLPKRNITLRRKFEGLVYEKLKINTPGISYAQKETPWRMYAQLKKLN